MAIRGSLREASLPDVLQLLAMGGKTGRLSVTNRRRFGQIYFDTGRICYASVVNRRDRLGDLLLKNGLVSPDELNSALDEQARTPERRIGDILVGQGAITREQLEHHIRVQIEEAVYLLFTWTDGTFFFETGVRPDEGETLVSIHPENVLLEGARRVDEWSEIEKKIPSLDLIFTRTGTGEPAEELQLSTEQRRMLPLLDGRYSLAEIIEELGIVEFDAGKALFGLIQAGLVVPSGKRERAAPEQHLSARLEEHRNLGVAFFRTGMHEEAVREFERVLELEPGNRPVRYHLALVELRRGAEREAIRQLRTLVEGDGPSVPTLTALALAFERLGRVRNALAAIEEALRIEPGHAGAMLSHAILLLKAGRLDDAVATFARYRERQAGQAALPAAYYAFAVLAHAAAGRLDLARELAGEGLARHPHSAPLLLNVGAVHERCNDWETAESLYRRACEEDSRLPQAHKALGDALYRRRALAEAADAYRYAVELDPGLGGDAYFKLGNLAYKEADRAEAIRLWRRALELNPGNDVVRTNLEVVESVLGEPEPAEATGDPAEAATRAPGEPETAEEPGPAGVDEATVHVG